MKDRVEEFLLAYKGIELACKEKGKDVVEMESIMGIDRYDPEASKLKLCRQLRNYCVHNDYDGFITIAPGMIKFAKGIAKDIKKMKLKVKKSKK